MGCVTDPLSDIQQDEDHILHKSRIFITYVKHVLNGKRKYDSSGKR